MKKEALRVTTTIPVAPTTLYFAWLDSVQHGAMTGSSAKIEPIVGSKFTARDNYISGKLITLDLGRRIVMSWRTTDFPRDASDSRVELHLEALGASTRVTILHTEVPEGQGEKCRAGWNDFYFGPMRTYFSKYLPDPRKPPPPRRPPPPEEEEEEVKPAKGGKGKKAEPAKGPGIAKTTNPAKQEKPVKQAKVAKPAPAKPSAPPKSLPKAKVAPTKAVKKPAPAKKPAGKPAAAKKSAPKKPSGKKTSKKK